MSARGLTLTVRMITTEHQNYRRWESRAEETHTEKLSDFAAA